MCGFGSCVLMLLRVLLSMWYCLKNAKKLFQKNRKKGLTIYLLCLIIDSVRKPNKTNTKEMPTMKNTYTMKNNYETRTFTADQFVEVLRDLLHITAEVAKMTMHKMVEGKTYLAGATYRIMKNKAEA